MCFSFPELSTQSCTLLSSSGSSRQTPVAFLSAIDVFLRHMHMHSECIVEEDAREENTIAEETPGKSQ